jgi:ribonucleoside-triphosphate reductase
MTTTNDQDVSIEFVYKRDGQKVNYDISKIANAIYKAAISVGGEDKQLAHVLAREVEEHLIYEYGEYHVPHVEQVQDAIVKILIENGHAQTVTSFITYRLKRQRVRERRNLIDVNSIHEEYTSRSDWRVKENSNTDYSFSGEVLYTAGKMMALWATSELYTKEIAEAHEEGYIHIHDLSHPHIGYCSGWSLRDLLAEGFGDVPNKADCSPAKHLRTAVHHMYNFIGTLQMEFAGAQAFNSCDTLLAPFVKKYHKELEQRYLKIALHSSIVHGRAYSDVATRYAKEDTKKYVKQCMQELVFSLNIPSRFGSQTPFSNLTFDWVVPNDLKDQAALLGGELMEYTYGELQKEMDLINECFLEVMLEGDARGRVFTFPIPTYNITKEFDWDNKNASLLFELTAKFGLPYFQNFVNSDLNPDDVRAMCCRLQLDKTQLRRKSGGGFGAHDLTGSIGVVTLNINRISYENPYDDDYLDKLEYYIQLAMDSLELKRKEVDQNLKKGLMPYAKRYLKKGFDNHFLTIGVVGVNEACINRFDKGIESEEGKRFAIATLKYIKSGIQQRQVETGYLFNLEATPAEGASYRLARLDRKFHNSDIYTSGSKEVPYLTNSTQLPVDLTNDLILAVEHQEQLQPIYTGGTMFHLYLGEKIPVESAKMTVKAIAEKSKLPYFSITPTFSICKNHGYLHGEFPVCPDCNEQTEVYSRVVGYYRPVKNWNDGKRLEFTQRRSFKV